MNEAQRLWDECAGILQAQVSEPVWLTSFEAARPTRLEGNVLTLAVPSFLAKERIEGRYLSLVRGALTEVGAADVELSLEIAYDPGRFDGAACWSRVAMRVPLIRRSRRGRFE